MGDASTGFDGFVIARHRSLARTAFLLTGDRGRAEDLVQTSLYQTFTHWDRLRSTQAAEACTRTTMVRLAGRWGRRRWLGERPSPDVGRAVAWPDIADASALGIDVRTALRRLPPLQRAAIVLRYFDDLSEADTAAVLGCSVGTVKSRVSRGLASLRANGLLADGPANGVSATGVATGGFSAGGSSAGGSGRFSAGGLSDGDRPTGVQHG